MMKKYLVLICVCISLSSAGVAQSFTLLTWNIQDLGRSKDATEIAAMVEILKDYDLIAIQEVVAKDPAGAQQVAKLVEGLNRKGARWDYRISLPTQSPSSYISERYALIWKTSRIQLVNSPYLDRDRATVVNREPFIGKFKVKGNPKPFFVANFHARRFDEKPEEEIKYLVQYPSFLETDRLFILGDFNLDEQHKVWIPLYNLNFAPALNDTPTTLKRKCSLSGNYFNHPIDNIYFHTGHFRRLRSDRVDFVGECNKLKVARGISDHLPVYLEVEAL